MSALRFLVGKTHLWVYPKSTHFNGTSSRRRTNLFCVAFLLHSSPIDCDSTKCSISFWLRERKMSKICTCQVFFGVQIYRALTNSESFTQTQPFRCARILYSLWLHQKWIILKETSCVSRKIATDVLIAVCSYPWTATIPCKSSFSVHKVMPHNKMCSKKLVVMSKLGRLKTCAREAQTTTIIACIYSNPYDDEKRKETSSTSLL